jgi:hypothetical protein
VAGMLIGCSRQFSDVDFLSEHGRRSTTTTRRDGPTHVVPTHQNAERVSYNNTIAGQMGVHRRSRVAIIVPLCYAAHADAAGVGDPCASLADEVS